MSKRGSEDDGVTVKRTRVLVACQRCKSKKKKCDGKPTCENCARSNEQCYYDTIENPALVQANQYSKQLETRIDHLEQELQETKRRLAEESSKPSPQPVEKSSTPAILNLITNNDNDAYVGNGAIISMVQTIRRLILGKNLPEPQNVQPKGKLSSIPISFIPDEVENDFITHFFNLAKNRYYIMDIKEFEAIRQKPETERTATQAFFYYAVLANGCRSAELCNVTIYPTPDYYFDKCSSFLEKAALTSLQQIQAALLLALFTGRSQVGFFGFSSWEMAGIASKKIIQMGLHRRRTVTFEHALYYEFCKRLFWSYYNYDRLLSLSLGRPFSIPDSDIDVPLPLNLDLVLDDPRQVYELQLQQEKNPNMKQNVTTFTALIETCKVRQIESRCHVNLFQVNKLIPTAETFDSLCAEIELWRSRLPSIMEVKTTLKGNESYDYFNLMYFRAMLILMLPRVTSSSLSPEEKGDILKKSSLVAGGICQSYKSLYKDQIRYALHTVFLAGVSLVYYLWNTNQKDATGNTHNDLRACSSLLFVFAERWPEARSYRDVFENLVENHLYREQRKTFDFNQLLRQIINKDDHPGKITENTFTFDENFWEHIDKMGDNFNFFHYD